MHKVSILTLWLAACAVGPDYEQPEPAVPEEFHSMQPASGHASDQNAEQQFWGGFNDPLLAGLIQQTLVANQSLHAAMGRYDRAAALLYGAEREQWPSVTASATAAEQYLAEVERTAPGWQRVELYQAGIAASWELDFFGRLRLATESEEAALQATGADLGALQVALVGQLASSYFELRGLQQQLQVAEQNVALQKETLDIVSARTKVGRGTEFDRVRARAQLQRTQAVLPSLHAGIRAAMHRIAVITGQPPAALIATLDNQSSTPEALPVAWPEISVDSPGAVLRRRPDIAAAERRLASATARIGVATADLFPRFTLGGLLGSVASDSSDLFTGSSESRRIALGIDWTFLDYGRVRARIESADADSRIALANYQQTVLSALEETETRLVRYQNALLRSEHLRLAAEDAEKAAALARTRYARGFIGYFEVLAAEQELTTTRDASVRSRTNVTLAMVEVYRSMAGAPPVAL